MIKYLPHPRDEAPLDVWELYNRVNMISGVTISKNYLERNRPVGSQNETAIVRSMKK